MNFEEVLAGMRPATPKKIAVAAAHDPAVLSALARGVAMGFCEPILCGDADKIRKAAANTSTDISKFEIIDVPDVLESARMAVELVRGGRADVLMKGLIQTADMMRVVLDRDCGIRGSGVLSHVSILFSPTHNRTFLLADAGMIMYPDLATKVAIINNTVRFARGFGISKPRVAVLAAVETVNPKMQATIDAAELTAMNERGEIADCVVYGPLAFDLAVSADAAKTKGVSSPVAGHADILLCHNIDVANSLLKSMVYFGGFIFGGLVMGADVPVIINSRADTEISKLYSIACACRI